MLPENESSLDYRSSAKVADFWCEDLGDLVIAPGMIDAHVHINEPGRTKWEGFETATRAAAAGGITTLIDMPLNSSPVTTSVEALHIKKRAAKNKCWVDVGFYAGVVPGNVHEIPGLIAEGVHGVKAFLCDSGLDEFPASSESDLRVLLPVLKKTGIPLLAHAEMVGNIPVQINDPRKYENYLKSRPDAWEINAIRMLINLCRDYQTPIHIVHLSTMDAFELICAAKADGLPLTVETCPHYLYFDAERIQDSQTQFKCAPPIRKKTNREKMCRKMAVSTLDFIDTIGSDHSPCDPTLKELEDGDFAKAWGGIAGLQLSMSVVCTVAKEFGWTLDQVVEWTSSAPAKIFGLDNRKGKLIGGNHADIVIWDPDETWQVESTKLHHRHSVSPYDGEVFQGRAVRTYVRGQQVFRDGSFSDKPSGMLLRRNS